MGTGVAERSSSGSDSAEPESLTGGLFGEYWWPTAADYCHKRLAQRAQGLPEDPLAHGVLSWIEYELALSTESQPRKANVDAKGDTAVEGETAGSEEDSENSGKLT